MTCREEGEILCRQRGSRVPWRWQAGRSPWAEHAHGGHGPREEVNGGPWKGLRAAEGAECWETPQRDGCAVSDGPDALLTTSPQKSNLHQVGTCCPQPNPKGNVEVKCGRGKKKHPHHQGARALTCSTISRKPSHSTVKAAELPVSHSEAYCPLALHLQLDRIIIRAIIPIGSLICVFHVGGYCFF